ncbi:MAG: N-acetyltransferase [Frankiaceae bacterium]|jgi:RimJ/RimL family protein N-acetyltransferase|nr:N-acetyltransferase [Frankiaceae bacterium]
MAVMPGGRSLVGAGVRLDPSDLADAAGIFAALDYDDVWAAGYSGGPSARPRRPDQWERRIEAAAVERRAMFTVRQGDQIIGTTSLGDTSLEHQRTHLGWTAYTPAAWGGAVNPECKLLLLTHAFEECGFGRVKIQTDSINLRSQAAIAKLGATREGLLRRHMVRPDGTTRDTVVFAVTIDDWPVVKAGLLARLAR